MGRLEQPTYLENINGKFKAEVQFDGKPQAIFWDDRDQGEDMTSGYIISKLGKMYTVRITVTQLGSAARIAQYADYPDLAIALVIDGVKREERLTDFKRQPEETIEIIGAGIGSNEEAPMYFTPLRVDSNIDPLTITASKNIGSICLEIKRCHKKYRDRRPPADTKVDALEARNRLNEADGKGPLGTVTGFTAPVKAAKSETYIAENHPEDKVSPYFTFEFRYRTKEVLVAQGIVECLSQSPRKKEDGLYVPSHIVNVQPRTSIRKHEQPDLDFKYAEIDELQSIAEEVDELAEESIEPMAPANAIMIPPEITTPRRVLKKQKGPSPSHNKRKILESDDEDEDDGYGSPSPSKRTRLPSIALTCYRIGFGRGRM